MNDSSEREENGGAKMARTLGPASIIFIGISSLLGGGIFSLLGPTINLVGPSLFLAMILGAFIAFLNLQMYAALGTTFPEAGGGYLWVRKGLGNFQGFLAGWLSWFAHAAACGVYALSFGYYAVWILEMFHLNIFSTLSFFSGDKITAIVMVVVFGYINWKGAKFTGKIGNYITVVLLSVLAGYVFWGVKHMSGLTNPLVNFHPFFPHGIVGVFAATCFFYIAFEGSEIQVQAGEETKNPARDIKIGLFSSWAIVSAIYIILSIIIIGASSATGSVWQMLGGLKEGAIVESAKGFMPYGALILAIGGFLANLAALNTTIFSSSHVAYALARDKNIWSRFSQIHTKNLTPNIAVIASSFLVILMVVFLPLFDVASAASLLFVLLFLQLNIAGILIHFKYPKTKWAYKIPLFPYVPLLAIIFYILLAFTMLQVNAVAWFITIIWFLLGLINYFSYANTQSRENFESKIAYEETIRVAFQTGRRILVPIPPEITTEKLRNLADIAIAVASKYGGEIIMVTVHKVSATYPMLDGSTMTRDEHLFEHMKKWVRDFNHENAETKDINLHCIAMTGRDTVTSLLSVIKNEDCDMILLSWDGFSASKGVLIGGKIDRILRETGIDVLIFKNPRKVSSILLAEESHGGNPYLHLTGEILSAIQTNFGAKMKLISVVPENMTDASKYPSAEKLLAPLALHKIDFTEIKIVPSRSILMTIIKEAEMNHSELVVMNASWPKIMKEIRLGNTPELLAKHLNTSVLIVRGHQGLAEAKFMNFLKIFS